MNSLGKGLIGALGESVGSTASVSAPGGQLQNLTLAFCPGSRLGGVTFTVTQAGAWESI
jgi:hypothetical protein